MCIHCGDLPTWRYHFADGRRFTSSMRRDYAEAQARAVETVDGVAITRIEEYVSGEWLSLSRKNANETPSG